MVDEAPTNTEADNASRPAGEPPAAKPKPTADGPPQVEFDPEACKAIAIGLDAFLQSMAEDEWEGTDYAYYLEPAGILHGPLRCSRAPEGEVRRAGLLMTRNGWLAKKVVLDDGINPETYELSFPKEFGYVKPLSHYREETREHAKFPWSKKY